MPVWHDQSTMLGIIINPKSGKKAMLMQRYYLFDLLKQKQIDYTYRVTKYAGHATELARELAEAGVRDFLILGGDGTISETVAGLMTAKIEDRQNIRFGIMPRGTGNDFARHWNLTKNYKDSLARYFNGKAEPIDVGCVTYSRNGEEHKHYFINSLGFGIDSKTLVTANTMKYYFGSHRLLYAMALIVVVFKHKSQMLHLKTDSGLDVCEPLFDLSLGNAPYCGGGIKLNSNADPSDGVFHMIFVKTPTFRQIIQAIGHLFDGKLEEMEFVYPQQAKVIEMDVEEVDNSEHCGQKLNHLLYEADGIPVTACTPFKIECLHHALQFVH